MRYRVTHKTEYLYEEPASLGYNEARLTPRSFIHPMFEQTCLSNKITVDPPYSDPNERLDFFGNPVLYFTLPQPHEQATITAQSEVDLKPSLVPNQNTARADLLVTQAENSPSWEAVRDRLQAELSAATLDARQFVMNSPLVSVFPGLADYAQKSFPTACPILEAVYNLMQRIYNDFDFVPDATTIATPLTEVLRRRRGVCQDYAHFMVGCLRAQGLAARYVSGYIETLPPPGQEKLVGADASHAWCSVYIPNQGWIDFDPTNNLIPKDQHITLAWGRDFSDVTPLKGVFFSHSQHTLAVSVDVERLET